MVPEIQVPDIEGWGSTVCRRNNQIAVPVKIDRNNGTDRAGGSHTRSAKHTAEAQAVLGQSFLEPRVLYQHNRSG